MRQLRRVASLRSIDDDSHEAARDNACNRKSDDSAHVNPRNHSPVDSSPVTVAKSDADGCASNTLGGGYWKFYATISKRT